MSWEQHEITAAQHFLRAMADVLRQSDIRVQSNDQLDRAATELVLDCVRSMRTLQETTTRFVDFMQQHDMLQGPLPANLHEQLEGHFKVREFNQRDRGTERER